MRKRAVDDFWARVKKTGSCWLWTGCLHRGYGRIAFYENGVRTSTASVHRLAYEMLVGPIPDGLQIDHLCRARNCVNPEHLEVVDQRTNILRGVGATAVHARKTHCKRGHLLSGSNPRIRRCRECKRITDARRYVR